MNATKKQLIALASNVNRIMSLNETDAINVNEKTATVATLTDAIKDLSGEFTTADFDPATAEEFRFSEEDVKTLSLIGIEPPKPVVTRRATVGGKKVRKAKANNGNATPKADLYTRSHSFVDAVKHGGTKDDIVKLSDKLYREKNPNAKPEGAKKPLFVAEVMFRYAMPSLLLLGAVVTGKNGEGKEVFNLSSDNPDAIKKPVTPAKSATPAKK